MCPCAARTRQNVKLTKHRLIEVATSCSHGIVLAAGAVPEGSTGRT